VVYNLEEIAEMTGSLSYIQAFCFFRIPVCSAFPVDRLVERDF
jgi:hypothetical protein